jgi:lipoprotein-anchoring transpeptidase ErfK/SrfK
VPTTNWNVYSGGAENFPRFLEDWNTSTGKKTFTYNGSMVVLFPSQYATSPWGMANVYDPPARNWAFDLNFMDAKKLPPGTPSVSTLIRGTWQIVSPKKPSS